MDTRHDIIARLCNILAAHTDDPALVTIVGSFGVATDEQMLEGLKMWQERGEEDPKPAKIDSHGMVEGIRFICLAGHGWLTNYNACPSCGVEVVAYKQVG